LQHGSQRMIRILMQHEQQLERLQVDHSITKYTVWPQIPSQGTRWPGSERVVPRWLLTKSELDGPLPSQSSETSTSPRRDRFYSRIVPT
jgi:hypothetical protein